MDFKKATELFADKDWDGEPEVIYEPGTDDSPEPPEPPPPPEPPGPDDTGRGDPGQPPVKYVITPVEVMVVAERVQYYGKDGKLITESLKDYTKQTVQEQYATVDDFLRRWIEADRKQAVIEELREHGVLLEALADMVGTEMDPFDLVCHVVYDRPPLTRRERANNVKKRDVFTKFGHQARAVLDALLEKYADEGLGHVEDIGVLRVQPLSDLGTLAELVNAFGGKKGYVAAVRDLEAALYTTAA
jgi:type I restriction enzyme R subunit